MVNNTDGKIKMRRVDDLVIMFYDKRTVYVQHHYGVTCYNRWWVHERGFSTKKWARFVETIAKKRKHLTWGDVNALAERFEINVDGCSGFPEVESDKIKWLP